MVFSFQKTYSPEIEQLLRQYSQSLSEKDRRRFAALEAITLGHGGIRSRAKGRGCDPQTVQDGMRELTQLPDDPAGSRGRKPGGGRHKTEGTQSTLTQQGQDTINHRTAGDPMRLNVVWTDVTPQDMSQSLREQSVFAAPRIVRRMLDGLGWARRQMAKGVPGGDSPHRGAPFRHLAHLIHAFLEAGTPVLRIDTKKKDCLGTLSRDGTGDGQQARKAFDPDFSSLATGVIMPHGIDDLARNQGWMPGGQSRDTTEFACESVRVCWHDDGQRLSPKASAILLLCDGGGRTSGQKQLCKEDLPGVVKDLSVPIRVAHSPAYCSKCNPSERRLFSPVTSACQGVVFDSLQTVLGLRQKTKTHQGRTVTVRVLDKRDAGGRTVRDACKKNRPIVVEKLLPKWNDWALPQ